MFGVHRAKFMAALLSLFSFSAHPQSFECPSEPKICRDSKVADREMLLADLTTSSNARASLVQPEQRTLLVVGLSYVIEPKTKRWNPGDTLTVAFLGGSEALHEKVEQTANRWTVSNGANIELIFRDSSGAFKTWDRATGTDATIRISFDGYEQHGYWSLVGRDAVKATRTEASMNLQDFDRALPDDWETIVLHEFGHALGFQHEHQNPSISCDFKYFDDENYEPSCIEGYFVEDCNEPPNRPGLIRYYGGPRFGWKESRVYENFDRLLNSHAYERSEFDALSIMRYPFLPFMFEAGSDSPCYSEVIPNKLSELDLAGASKVYPYDQKAIAEQLQARKLLFQLAVAAIPQEDPVAIDASSALATLE